MALMTATLLAGGARAQNRPASTLAQGQQPSACLNDISKFEQSIALVRQTAGDKAAAELKEKLLPSTQANEILSQTGSCGLSRHLRSKKLV